MADMSEFVRTTRSGKVRYFAPKGGFKSLKEMHDHLANIHAHVSKTDKCPDPVSAAPTQGAWEIICRNITSDTFSPVEDNALWMAYKLMRISYAEELQGEERREREEACEREKDLLGAINIVGRALSFVSVMAPISHAFPDRMRPNAKIRYSKSIKATERAMAHTRDAVAHAARRTADTAERAAHGTVWLVKNAKKLFNVALVGSLVIWRSSMSPSGVVGDAPSRRAAVTHTEVPDLLQTYFNPHMLFIHQQAHMAVMREAGARNARLTALSDEPKPEYDFLAHNLVRSTESIEAARVEYRDGGSYVLSDARRNVFYETIAVPRSDGEVQIAESRIAGVQFTDGAEPEPRVIAQTITGAESLLCWHHATGMPSLRSPEHKQWIRSTLSTTFVQKILELYKDPSVGLDPETDYILPAFLENAVLSDGQITFPPLVRHLTVENMPWLDVPAFQHFVTLVVEFVTKLEGC